MRAGVKELLVVSQDTSAYGVDLKYAESAWRDRPVRARFYDLTKNLGELGAWVRLHYVYPYPHVDEVIPLMRDGLVLPYLDIPFQHASPRVLKSMRRPAHGERTLERIRRWREVAPDLAIRSTFIVGFPGETEEDHDALLGFVEAAGLDWAGLFPFSPEDGTPAAAMDGAVDDVVVKERLDELSVLQDRLTQAARDALVGTRVEVLVDGKESGVAVGRTHREAPEIDGVVRFAPTGDHGRPAPGTIVTADVVSAIGPDLEVVVA